MVIISWNGDGDLGSLFLESGSRWIRSNCWNVPGPLVEQVLIQLVDFCGQSIPFLPTDFSAAGGVVGCIQHAIMRYLDEYYIKLHSPNKTLLVGL